MSLSLTAATFLFFQHEEFSTLNEETQRRDPGENDPKLLYLIPTTLFYILVNTPRIFSNGFVLAVAPHVAIIFFVIEFAFGIFLSNRYVHKITDNEVVPGGLLLAITNVMSPTGPIGRIGVINTISSLITICKIGFIFIIVKHLDHIHWLMSGICDQPDLFRCFDEDDFRNSNCSKPHYYRYPNNIDNKSPSIISPRSCGPDEIKNDVVTQTIVILTLSIVMISIPAGFLISFLIRKEKLEHFEKVVGQFCCKEDDERKESKGYEGGELYEFETRVHAEVRPNVAIEIDEDKIERPAIILKDIRRVFAFPVKSQEDGNYLL